MDDLEGINDRLAAIEQIANDRPGEAVDELQDLLGELDEPISNANDHARALLRNEDYPGCALLLNETGVLFQRLSTLALVLRDEIRRRR